MFSNMKSNAHTRILSLQDENFLIENIISFEIDFDLHFYEIQ